MLSEDSFELEQTFIDLAVGDGNRRVRTPEGARFYGQPIGTIITAEMIRAKKLAAKAEGKKAPKGGLSKKPKLISPTSGSGAGAAPSGGNNASAAPSGGNNASAAPSTPEQPGAAKPAAGQKFTVQPPTIKGPQPFSVGNAKYSAPAGAKIYVPKSGAEMAYIVTADGEVHVFNASGEIVQPDYLQSVLKTKFRNFKGDDALYKSGTFDGAASLTEQKPGAKLSKDGKPAFTKQANGTWLNEDFGIELTDEDLQKQYDSGKFDLESATTVEDIDFSKMTEDELEAALEAMPEGKQLKLGQATLTKKGKSFESSLTAKRVTVADVVMIGQGSDLLSDKLDTPEAVPSEPAKAEKAAKDAKAADPIMNPEKILNPENAQKEKAKDAKVTGAEVLSAEVGTTLYHDQMGAVTKSEVGKWTFAETGNTFGEEALQVSGNGGFLSKEPWDQKQIDAKAKFDEENTLTVNGKKVNTVAKFGENDRSEKIKADGGSTPNVFELEATPENAKTFRDAMAASLEGNPYAASVYMYDEKDYEGMRLFLADDGKSGIALHDGDEIVSVFSDPKSKNKKVARHLISVAVENGGKRLDAFDTVLPSIYAKEGFQVKARLKWNDEYAPDGWDKETFSKFNGGEPDVVFMAHEPGMEDLDYEAGVGDYVDDYDAGLASTGGKAQDENDYRPESGDPDNDESEVDTTPGGWVISDDVTQAISEGKKLTAIKALIAANPDKPNDTKLVSAKKEIESMMTGGIAPGSPFETQMLFDLPKGSKFEAPNGTVFTKNDNGNWVTPNGGVYTSAEMAKSSPNGAKVLENPSYIEKKNLAASEEAPEFPDFEPQNPVPDEDYLPIPDDGIQINDVSSFGVGDKINIQTPSETLTLVKMDSGWETTDGFMFTDEDVDWDIRQGHVWLPEDEANEKFPDDGDVDDDDEPVNPDAITVEKLQNFLDGEQVKVNGNIYTMQSNGSFEDKNGFTFEAQDFQEDIEAGWVEKVGAPTENLDEQEASSAPATGGFKNTKQTEDAISALEAHSGFQIAYGLKSLPADHPLKDKEFLDETVAKAKAQYPDLSPKNALIQHLKFTLGKEDLADWEKDLLDDSPKKNVGSRTPKNTATGVTGGQFTENEIQQAIDILEAFQGKAFKSELNKKGSPLGKLSPNDIVGFDKDKTVTKQKFIDLLKTKVSKPEVTPEPVGDVVDMNPAPAAPFINADKDISFTPEPGKVIPVDDDANLSALEQAPVGTLIERPSSVNGDAIQYEKNNDGNWRTPGDNGPGKKSNSILFYNSAMLGKLTWSKPAEVIPPETKGHIFTSVDELSRQSIGTRVAWKNHNGSAALVTKTGQNSWVHQDGDLFNDDTFYYGIQKKNVTYYDNVNKNESETPEELPEGVQETPYAKLQTGDKITSKDQFQKLVAGDKVLYKTDYVNDSYEKLDNGKWSTPLASEISHWSFDGAIEKGYLYYEGNSRTDNQHFSEEDVTLESTVGAVVSQLSEMDKAVSILPAEERGENGDGFVVVNTEDGPKITWGKFGAGGIATVAVDENGVKKVLVGKRGDRDEWYLPGGAIDENESHLQGSLREFAEEVEDGESLLNNIKITAGFQASIGTVEGTDKEWKYVTSVAELPTTMDIKAPAANEPWELSEYKWFSADELQELEDTGKLHSALSGGKLAHMVGFKDDLDMMMMDLKKDIGNQPPNLGEVKHDISTWTKVAGGQGGSNPGGVYIDTLGNKWYVKESNGGDAPAHSEVIAGALYDALGVNSNKVELAKNGDSSTTFLATPWVENDGNKLPNSFDNGDPDFIKKVQADFAIDAWLDNYDVAGIGPWNIVADSDGNPFRIDPGGALGFRATGGKKAWWSDNPTAIDDMRTGSNQSSAYTYLPQVFGGMTDEDVKDSAKKLLNITPQQINALVMSSGYPEDEKVALATTLVNRRQAILDRFGLGEDTGVTDSYLSKNGLEITPKVANFILEGDNSSGIAEFQFQHQLTLAKAKEELFDFAMDAVGNNKTNIQQYKKPSSASGFAKGSTVKVKGTNQQFAVELSNNEATAGIVDGKMIVYLNDEVSADLTTNPDIDATYAFTSNGKTFNKLETVGLPDPKNQSAQIEGIVLEADWSSGLVKVAASGNIIEIDKTNLKKVAQPAGTQTSSLPDGYAIPPSGANVLYETEWLGKKMYAVEHPGGDGMHIYNDDGSAYFPGYSMNFFEKSEKWKPFGGGSTAEAPLFLGEGYATPPAGATIISKHSNGTFAVMQDGVVYHYNTSGSSFVATYGKEEYIGGAWKTDYELPKSGPVDMSGDEIAVGDQINIMKYNKGGFSKKAKIVSINVEKGTAKVRRLDENGVAVVDENGKAVYANVSLTSIRKEKLLPNANGLPTGITMSGGDTSSPYYGKPEPKAPVAVPAPGQMSSTPIVSDEWIGKAEKAYEAYRQKKNLSPKALKDSSTAWEPISKAMKGDQQSLDVIKNKGYLDDDPALYEEIQSKMDEQKSKYNELVANYAAEVDNYQKAKSEWMTANGVAAYTPVSHDQVLSMSQDESYNWTQKTFKGVVNKLTSKAKSGLSTQKGSSAWQEVIRKLPAILGLRREDVANAPGVYEENMKTWDNIKEATDIAGPIGEGWRAVRTISFDRLVGPDGKQLSSSDDLTKIIGTIQKDHGAMEVVAGSVDHGGKVVDFYPVIMDLAVPPEVKGVYTGGVSGDDYGFSYSEESGIILEPGLAMYISDAKKNASGKWVVKASIIPREVLPYMNNFEGEPTSHNILIPGKDTTTGIPTTPTVNNPTVKDSEFTPQADGMWTKEGLDAAPNGYAVKDKNGKVWTKDQGVWKNAANAQFFSEGLVFNEMNDAYMDLVMNSGDDDLKMPAKSYTETELTAAVLGSLLTDADGDVWKKVEGDKWELMVKNGTHFVDVGEKRSSWAVASYTDGMGS